MAKSKKTNFDKHLERELKNPKFVKGFCEELEKTRLAIKKSINDSFKNTIEQLEKKQVKRKKITKELLELSKHTHPISTKEIVGELRKDRQK